MKRGATCRFVIGEPAQHTGEAFCPTKQKRGELLSPDDLHHRGSVCKWELVQPFEISQALMAVHVLLQVEQRPPDFANLELELCNLLEMNVHVESEVVLDVGQKRNIFPYCLIERAEI